MADKLTAESQKLEQDTLIQLFEIDARDWGHGILRFTNQPASDGNSLRFNGYDYASIPIIVSGFAWATKGTQKRPTMKLPAIDEAAMSLLIGSDSLVGAQVKRIQTYAKHLDDGSDPDPEQTRVPDYYRIERVAERNSTTVSLELSNYLIQTDRQIPYRQCIRDTCTHRYRYWNGQNFDYSGVTCPYSGDDYYDLQGNRVQNPADDICSKDLTKGCKRRYGENGVLPFRGFPGLGRT